MAHYTFTKVFSTDPDGELALDQGYQQSDLDTAFVRNRNRLYRWFAASTAAPSGDVVVAPENADVSTPGRWILQGPPSTVFDPATYSQVTPFGFNAACCFILSSREDLINIAGDGSPFILPSGCYIVTEDIDLEDDEWISIAGANVRMDALAGATITGNATPALIQVNGSSSFTAKNLNLVQQFAGGSSIPAYLSLGGVTTLRGCNFEATGTDSVGMYLVDGPTYAWKCNFLGSRHGAQQIGGFLRADQCLFEGAVENGYFMDEGDLFASKSVFRALSADFAMDVSGIARLFLTDCEVTVVEDAAIPCIILDGDAQATIRGGRIFGNVAAQGIGIRCANGNEGYPIIDGVHFSQLATAIWNLAGGIPEAAILACNSSDDTVAQGVNWTTVRIPPNGLVEWGNQFDTATPYVGHTPAIVERVNRKANTETGALSSETPIVP